MKQALGLFVISIVAIILSFAYSDLVSSQWRFFLIGMYPADLMHVYIISTVTLILAFFCFLRYTADTSRITDFVLFLSLALLSTVYLLQGIGFAGTGAISGIYISLYIGIVCNLLGTPVGYLMALLKTSSRSLTRFVATAYIEVFRGTPMVAVMFMSVYFLPALLNVKLPIFFVILLACLLCSSAYQAEVFFTGMDSKFKNHTSILKSLNISTWKSHTKVLLPLLFTKLSIPITNQYVSILKDSSLIIVVGVFEAFGTLRLIMGNQEWQPYFFQGFVFCIALYMLMSSLLFMSGVFIKNAIVRSKIR